MSIRMLILKFNFSKTNFTRTVNSKNRNIAHCEEKSAFFITQKLIL